MSKGKKLRKEEIIDFLKEHRGELQKRFGVTKIGLFGSFSRNSDNKTSDIDIAVELDSENKFRAFFELKYYLEENFARQVDLGIESTLKREIKESISKDIIYV
jgi:predicted nucleotidyltransferase